MVSPFTVSNQGYFAKVGHGPAASDDTPDTAGTDQDISYKAANFFSHATKEKIIRNSLNALSM